VLTYYDIQQNTLAWNDQTLDPLDTLCVYGYNLLGIETGIAEERTGMNVPLVIQSLLSLGSPLQLNDVGAVQLEVWSSSGALAGGKRLVATTGGSIPTDGWNAGMYFVRALDRHGLPIKTERFMIE
jgi:hypothetical protein